jgi:hypothetical protein
MSINPLLKTRGYFAVKSDKPLEVVCHRLQQHYGLPNFDFDVEAGWEYANSSHGSIAWNVKKTEDTETISEWMETAAEGVNYQFILMVQELHELNVKETEPLLTNILDAPVKHYDTICTREV